MGLVPGKNFSYSDHEGVAATFVVNDTLGTDRTGKSLYLVMAKLC